MDRICFQRMRHEEGDEEVSVKDCILLASGSNRKKDLPFIAKVTALWENPDDGKYQNLFLWIKSLDETVLFFPIKDSKKFVNKNR